MAHTVMGTIIAAIAACCFASAIIVAPILRVLELSRLSRYSFAAFMTGLGAYLSWVSALAYRDLLGPVNYEPELLVLRLVTLVSGAIFVVAATRCSLKLYKTHDGPNILGLMREPRWRKRR